MPACTRRSQVVHFDTRRSSVRDRVGARRQCASAARRRGAVGAPVPAISTRASPRPRAITRTCCCNRPERPGAARTAVSAGTIARSTSTRCATAAASPGRHARLLGVSRRRVPGEVAGEDAAARSTSRATASFVRFDFSANAFLHHMVRNIVGALVVRRRGQAAGPSGSPSCSPARDRTRAAPTFAADGLYFRGADYDRALRGLSADDAAHVSCSRGRRELHACARASRSAASRASPTRSRGSRRRRRRDRARVLARHAARRRRRPGARDRRRAAAVRDHGRAVRRSRRRGRFARCSTPVPLDVAAVPRQRAGRTCAARSDAATSRRFRVKDGVDLLESVSPYDDAAGLAVRCVRPKATAGRHRARVRLGAFAGRRSQPFAVPADPFGRT